MAQKTSDFYDVYYASLNRQGEELCGDQVKILRTADRTLVVLSDGLGSGVKASILATLTTEIIMTMLRESVPLKEIIETVIGTLPISKERGIAYSTFVIVEIHHDSNRFNIFNFDSPPVFLLKEGRVVQIEHEEVSILGKTLWFMNGLIERDDFIGVVSDGILYAGLGVTLNFGWGWEGVAEHMEQIFKEGVPASKTVVDSVIDQAKALYGNHIGDDATFVGIYARKRNTLMVFTGPPLKREWDESYVNRLLNFDGRRVVCGGTTSNLVAEYSGKKARLDAGTMTGDYPPMGSMAGVDLVTEGILTMAATLKKLQECRGKLSAVPEERTGPSMLTREMLSADSIHFLVGQSMNPFHQNPLLPKNISIRRNIVEQIVALLRKYNKEISVEYC
ncbi:MAG: SpoIIE family protein phosphatase [Syntrophobacteraceae bacterium]